MNLNGNTIFITGGGSGIGRALAEALHKLGNKVIISGRRAGHLAETTEANPGMESIELDVSYPESIRRAAEVLVVKYPALNVLINNAGIMEIDDASTLIDDDLISRTITTNLMGPIRLTGALVEHMKKQESATILIVSSVLGFTPMAMTAVYSSTKAALHSYSQSLRFKLRHTSVRVLEVIPPWVRTELLNSSEEPRAMPLDDFIRDTVVALATDADEILVPRAKFLRDQQGSQEASFVNSFNEQLEQPPVLA
ncbi:Oxidoreductase, short-chain dehydrogenase/reductase family (plasmid) [Acidisarcina polymorpha]|uniref:Oxidoreductase, short-chain dehydrogenase/reductase family n=1 Tax=Acidisarcina polymorpha TaxID=2211140 RepID=A0A2Z5GBK2_9BACT|nr:SDR family NAD(P)-dependent oxidoreductase [Acidisarcina polymorpha]AXC16388.1 Oxidoreductase, short-chain dehydrogenase/reductase family [Acidisarcina polymorpha]